MSGIIITGTVSLDARTFTDERIREAFRRMAGIINAQAQLLSQLETRLAALEARGAADRLGPGPTVD